MRVLFGLAVLALSVVVFAALALACVFVWSCNFCLAWLGDHVDDLEVE
jgi:hypothetical protein